MDYRLSPFSDDGAGLPAERILTLSDITLLVLCCMLALNFLLIPLLDFSRVMEIDLPEVTAEAEGLAVTDRADTPNPVLHVRLANPAAASVDERLEIMLDGRPVSLDQVGRRLVQTVQPDAQHLELRGDATLTAQDLVEILTEVGESGVSLPGGVQIHVRVADEAQGNAL